MQESININENCLINLNLFAIMIILHRDPTNQLRNVYCMHQTLKPSHVFTVATRALAFSFNSQI